MPAESGDWKIKKDKRFQNSGHFHLPKNLLAQVYRTNVTELSGLQIRQHSTKTLQPGLQILDDLLGDVIRLREVVEVAQGLIAQQLDIVALQVRRWANR